MAPVPPDAVSNIITSIVIALLTIFIGFMTGKLLGMIFSKLLSEFGIDKSFEKAKRRGILLSRIIGQVISVLVYAATIIIALSGLGVINVLWMIIYYILLLLVAGSIILYIIYLFPNIIGWLKLQFESTYKPGSRIDHEHIHGKILTVKFLHTEVLSESGDVIYIPNTVFM